MRVKQDDIIVEHAVLMTVPVKVPKRIVGRKVFKLDEQIRKDVPDRLHKLVHEGVHLRAVSTTFVVASADSPLGLPAWRDARQCRAGRRGSAGYWFRDQDRWAPWRSRSANATLLSIAELTVDVGLMPAPATYKSLPKRPGARPIEKRDTHSLPMLMGRPLAPRSPRPRIREPISGRGEPSSEAKSRRTVCDDSDAGVVDAGPHGEHVADAALVLDGDVQALWAAPDVGVVEARIADLGWVRRDRRARRELTVGVYRMGIISWWRVKLGRSVANFLCAPTYFRARCHKKGWRRGP